MNIKVFGFTWEVEPPISIENFLKYVQSLNSVEIKALGVVPPPGVNYHRIILTTALDDGLWGGVLLTVKNARKFIRSTKASTGKGFTISTGEIGSDENFADANFFIYNPKTGAGLYEYYHLSAFLNTFNHQFVDKFRGYKSINRLQGKLSVAPFLTKNDLAARVKQLAAVHHVEYEFSTIDVPTDGAVPASGLVERQRTKVFYDRNFQNSDLLKRDIASFVVENFGRIKRMFIKGKTVSGDDISYSIADDPSVFHEKEFKNYIVKLDIDENVDAALKNSSNLIELVKLSNNLKVKDFFYAERKR